MSDRRTQITLPLFRDLGDSLQFVSSVPVYYDKEDNVRRLAWQVYGYAAADTVLAKSLGPTGPHGDSWFTKAPIRFCEMRDGVPRGALAEHYILSQYPPSMIKQLACVIHCETRDVPAQHPAPPDQANESPPTSPDEAKTEDHGKKRKTPEESSDDPEETKHENARETKKPRKFGADAGPPRRPLTDEEVRALIDQCSEATKARDTALITLAYWTGFRVSELLSIDAKDVIGTNGVIKDAVTVAAPNMKGKARPRIVLLNQQAKEAIRPICEGVDRKEPLFRSSYGGVRLKRAGVWRLIRKLAIKAKLPDVTRISANSFRKTFAQKRYEGNQGNIVAVQAALGHESAAATLRYVKTEKRDIEAELLNASPF